MNLYLKVVLDLLKRFFSSSWGLIVIIMVLAFILGALTQCAPKSTKQSKEKDVIIDVLTQQQLQDQLALDALTQSNEIDLEIVTESIEAKEVFADYSLKVDQSLDLKLIEIEKVYVVETQTTKDPVVIQQAQTKKEHSTSVARIDALWELYCETECEG